MSEAFDWKKVLDTNEAEAAANAEAALQLEPAPQQMVEVAEEPLAEHSHEASNGVADDEGRDTTYRPAAIPTDLFELNVEKGKFSAGLEKTPSAPSRTEGHPTVENFHLDEILRQAFERKASDIHLTVGLPPMIRIDGELTPLPYQPLRPQDTRRLIFDTLSDDNVHKLEKTHELDFGYGVKDIGRFRFNVYMQRSSYAGALRAIPTKIPSFEELCLPPIVREMAKRTSGLILVTGPTGSGKSTTIASMIDDINTNTTTHIMTIEDPIEYLH